MSIFAQRSTQKELIDEPGIPFSDWEVCLKELNIVNTYLGGHNITIEGVSSLLDKQNNKSHMRQQGTFSIHIDLFLKISEP